MSRSIDERIVDLQFNNKQFETGVQDTLKSLDNLKNGLNLEGAGQSLDGVGEAAGKLGSAFSMLEIIATTALVKLTSAAMDFSINMARSLMIDPIMAGFSQYESKIGSMKAIMNATNMTAKEVGEALAGVIFYSDETSYSFNQMATAIRLFTSSGIEIEDAVQQIQGLGSAAALAGVETYKMESVFDAVSKAIGQGSVKIREWDSLSIAGLTTSNEFKQILLDTAIEMGNLTKVGEGYITNYVDPISGKAKEMAVSITDMRTALKSGWLDKAVLQSTLTQFGDYANDVYLLTEKFTDNSERLLAKYGKTMDDVFSEVGASSEEAAEITRLMTKENYSFEKALLTVKGSSLIAAQAMNILSDGTEHFGERGMRAAQEARTLSETLEAIRNTVAARWRDTWELLIGDVDEATELFGGLVNTLWDLFVTAGDTRNALLKLWRGVDEGDIDGRDILLEGIVNIGNSLLSVLEAIGDAWSQIFPPMSVERLLEIIQGFANFTEKLIPSEETLDKLTRTMAGLFAAADIVRMGIVALLNVVAKIIGIFMPATGGILSITAGLGDFIVAVRDVIKDGDGLVKVIDFIGSIFTKVADLVSNAVHSVTGGVKLFGSIDLSPIKKFGSEIEETFKPFDLIAKVFDKIAPIYVSAITSIGKALVKFGQIIGNFLREGHLKSFLDAVNSLLLGGVLLGIRKFVNTLTTDTSKGLKAFTKNITGITKSFSGTTESITKVLDGVRGSLEAYQQNLKSKALLNIASAIAILAGAIFVLSRIDPGDMTAALSAMTVLFIELSAAMMIMSKNLAGTIKMGAIAGTLTALSIAVLILSAAMKVLAGIEWEDILKGSVAIAIMSSTLVAFSSRMYKYGGEIIKGSLSLITMSIAILILTKAVKGLAKLNIQELAIGLLGVAGLMYTLSEFTFRIKPTELMSTSIAMIAIGIALNIMAKAVEKMGSIPFLSLLQGLSGVIVLLGAMVGLSKFINPTELMSTGLAMIPIGIALNIMAKAVQTFGGMDFLSLASGMSAMIVSLGAMIGFAHFIQPEKLLKAGLAMIPLGIGLTIIAGAIKILGAMSIEQAVVGIVTLAGALSIIIVAMQGMTNALAGAAALVVVSIALMMLIPSILLLGTMNIPKVVVGLLALAGVFTVLGLAAKFLTPFIPSLLSLAGAIALLGLAALAVGAGLTLFAAGLAALAVSGVAGANALVAILETLFTLTPTIATAVATAIIVFAAAIVSGMPTIMNAVLEITKGLIAIFVQVIPDVVDAIMQMILKILQALEGAVGPMTDAGLKILIGFIKGIRDNIKELTVVAIELISEFLSGLAEGIPQIATSATQLISAFIIALGVNSVLLADAGADAVIAFLNGLGDSIRTKTPELVAAGKNLAKGIMDGITAGVKEMVKAPIDAVVDLGKDMLRGFKKVLGIESPSKEFIDAGEDIGVAPGIGVKNTQASSEKAVEDLAYAMKHKFIEEDLPLQFEEFGEHTIERYITGLNSMGEALKESFAKVFGVPDIDKETFEKLSEEEKTSYSERSTMWQVMSEHIDDAIKTIENRLTSYTEVATDRFNRISVESETSVRDMINNLKHNQVAISEWADNIAKLANKGLNEGLLEELRQAGPKSAGEVKALVSASDKEIAELNKVMDNGAKVATKALLTSLGGAPPLAMAEGQNITDAVAKGLLSSNSLNESMALLITHAKNEGMQAIAKAEFVKIGQEVPEETAKGVKSGTPSLTKAVEGMGKEGAAAGKVAGKDISDGALSGLKSNDTEYQKTGSKYGIDFSNALSNTQTSSNTSGRTVAKRAEEGIKHNLPIFGQTGEKSGNDYSNSLSNTQTASNTSGRTVAKRAEDGIKHNQPVFGQTGTKSGTDYADAFGATKPKAETSGKDVVAGSLNGFKSYLEPVNQFTKVGEEAGAGFVKGLESYISRAEEAGRKLAKASKSSMENALKVKSPSREFFKIGSFTGLGFVNGLMSVIDKIESTAEELGNAALDGLNNVIDKIIDLIDQDFEDYSPTITPVLDLSEIQNGSESISQLLSGVKSVAPVVASIGRIVGKQPIHERDQTQIGKEDKDGDTYNFTQNNYSPKALTRLEIYRQTKNQFAQFKEVVDNA